MANSTITRELHRNSSKREVYNGKYLKDKLKNVASVLRAIGLSGKLYGSLSNIILLKNSGRLNKYPDILLKKASKFHTRPYTHGLEKTTELWKLVHISETQT